MYSHSTTLSRVASSQAMHHPCRPSPPVVPARLADPVAHSPTGSALSDWFERGLTVSQPTRQGSVVAVSPPAPVTTYPKVVLCPGLSEPFQLALWTITSWPV